MVRVADRNQRAVAGAVEAEGELEHDGVAGGALIGRQFDAGRSVSGKAQEGAAVRSGGDSAGGRFGHERFGVSGSPA
jgi:hypothetical protein